MKNLIFVLILLISVSFVNAQEYHKKSRNEIKAEKNAIQAENVKNLLENKTFVFDAMQAVMKDKSRIDLLPYYSLKIENNEIISHLPFYSTVYENELELQNSPFNFTQQIHNYNLQKEDKHYILKIETANNLSTVIFTFYISKLGHTSLKVTSTNRRCITFKGIIKESSELQAVK